MEYSVNKIFDKETYKPQISIVGRRNVGKSTLLNKLIEQEYFKVSENPGTTINPIEKEYELIPFGPVILVDTAGIEEEGELGDKKLSQTIKILSKSDLIVVVLDARYRLHPKEIELFANIDKLNIDCIVAVNKIEYGTNPILLNELRDLRITHFEISCKENVGIDELKRKIIRFLPKDDKYFLIKDLISKGSHIIIVIPEKRKIPKPRIFRNHLQILTEALENESIITLCREDEFQKTLDEINVKPDLIIADCDGIKKIIGNLPSDVKITTFNLILSRYKSDLKIYLNGIRKLEHLQNGDRIIITELCIDHPYDDEIAGDKIPLLMEQYLNKKLNYLLTVEDKLPDDLSDIKLIVQCNCCSKNRETVRHLLNQAILLDIPIVNYSLLAAYLKGVLPRVIEPFINVKKEWDKLNLTII
ncbi:MAG: [FeFe] hydrogenase H-cluster maturation GTPase HydF [Ignavibacterium sp.]|nr:[FeFe] hydrogenase H-cluster maturation GTPase HydF [Ignavibacterium sp.]MDW8374690.1 [FeFe] hydrogenase H-cluster maturation GTPase HydF [Ignavibacteriales bacterium]